MTAAPSDDIAFVESVLILSRHVTLASRSLSFDMYLEICPSLPVADPLYDIYGLLQHKLLSARDETGGIQSRLQTIIL